MDFKTGWAVIMEKGISPLETCLSERLDRSRNASTGDKCHWIAPPLDQKSIEKLALFRPKDLMELYTIVYTMSTQREMNYSERLFEKHGQVIQTYLEKKVLPQLQGKSGYELLEELQFHWENHLIMNHWLDIIFAYLNRYYIKANMEPTLKQRGLQLFRSQVMTVFGEPVREALLSLIADERQSKPINRSLISAIVSLYITLGMDSMTYYYTDFEEHFLTKTSQFYQQESETWLANMTFNAYMHKVESLLEIESQRCHGALHESTWPKVLLVLQSVLLTDRLPTLFEKSPGLQHLLETKQIEDIQCAYRLLSLIDDGIAALAKEFKTFISNRGSRIVEVHTQAFNAEIAKLPQDDTRSVKNLIQKQCYDHTVIEEYIELHDECKMYLQSCFNQDLIFKQALKEAFDGFMGKVIGHHTIAAYLSASCDQLLRSQMTNDSLNHDQLDLLFDKIVELFSYLPDKDLFAELYRSQLDRRLLTGNYKSLGAENRLLKKLKIKCGPQYTSKLEGMIHDVRLAADINDDFIDYTQNTLTLLPISNFQVLILTTGSWPTYTLYQAKLPPPMNDCMDIFKTWYIHVKTSHRRLVWIHHLGVVHLTGRLNQQTFTIQCNTLQACILLLFNDADTLSFSTISETLDLDPVYAKKLLASLLVVKLLLKSYETDGCYTLNTNLVSKHSTLKVPIPLQDKLSSLDKAEEDHSFAVEAAIVRIMKLNKQMHHSNLVAQVCERLHAFQPSTRAIKARIESLIDREFIERSPDNVQEYRSRYKWLIFTVTYVTYIVVYVGRKSFSLVKPFLQKDFPIITTEDLGYIDTAFYSSYALSQIVLPGVVEGCKDHHVLSASLLAQALLLVAFGHSHSKWGFIAVWFGMGISQSLIFPILLRGLNRVWASGNQSRLLSFWVTSQQVGSALGSLLVGWISANEGWKEAVFVSACLTASNALIILICLPRWLSTLLSPTVSRHMALGSNAVEMVDYSMPQKDPTPALDDIGKTTFTETTTTENVNSHWKHLGWVQPKHSDSDISHSDNIDHSECCQPSQEAAQHAPRLSFWQVFKTRDVLLCGIAYFFVKFVRYALLSWLPYLIARNQGYSTAGSISAVFDIGGFLGCIGLGYLANNVHARKASLTIVSSAVAAVCLSALAFAFDLRSSQGLLLFATGVFNAVPDCILGAAIALDVCKRNFKPDPSAKLGTVYGIINGLGAMGAIIQGVITVALLKFRDAPLFFLCLSTAASFPILILLPLVEYECADYPYTSLT